MHLDHAAATATAVSDLAAPAPDPDWKAPSAAAPPALQRLWEALGMRPGLRVEQVVQQLIEVARRIEASDRAIALDLVQLEEGRLYEAGGYRSVHEFAEAELDLDRGRVDELLALGKWGRTACNELARNNAARRAAIDTEPVRGAPARPVVSSPNVRREPPGLASSAWRARMSREGRNRRGPGGRSAPHVLNMLNQKESGHEGREEPRC